MNYKSSKYKEFQIQNPTLMKVINSASSASVASLIVQPLEVLKTRCQTVTHLKFDYILNDLKNILRSNPSHLWNGSFSSVTRVSLGFGIYVPLMCVVAGRDITSCKNLSPLKSFLLAFSCRSITSMILLPITVIQTRNQWLRERTKLFSSFKTVYKNESIRGFYRGIFPTIIRDAPSSGLYLAIYNMTKRQISSFHLISNNKFLNGFVCGLSGGVISSLITNPFDVIKTNLQVPIQNGPITSMEAIKFIYENDGLRGFFRGSILRICRKSLQSAIVWGLYEYKIFH